MDSALRLAVITVALVATGASGTVAAQAQLSYERSGLGLKTQAGTAQLPADFVFGGESQHTWQILRASEYTLYGGAREQSRAGLRATEQYGGIVYSMPRGWASSIEAGMQEQLLSPRRFTLTGQMHASISDGRSISVGLRYRTRETLDEPPIPNGYTLAPSLMYGSSAAPGYQMLMGYQYGLSSTVGLTLGRDIETSTPLFDVPGSGPRQFSLTGQHWLTPSWALSYDVLSNDAMTPLRLQSLRLGVRYRF